MNGAGAAGDVGASVWVAASAGTGKTYALTDRVLALLLAGSDPSRLLCLTFTKAAAAEMANRVNERLSKWTTMPDGALTQELQRLTAALPDAALLDAARRLFARVLDTPGGMRIQTIHAFCQSLLRRFPLEAGVAPHFELMDDRSAGEALAAAREAVLLAAREGHDAALAEALAEVTSHVPEAGFGALLDALSTERARLSLVLQEGIEAFAAALYEHLGLEPGETAAQVLDAACAVGACDEAALRRAVEVLRRRGTVKTDQPRGVALATWLATPAARGAGLDSYLAIFLTRESAPRVNILTRKLADQEPAAAQALAAEADRLVRLCQRRAAAALAQATLALVRLAAALIAAYETHKRRRALLDYDDLVLRTRDLLRRPGVAPWVLFKLDGGLDHILIDEAQDTNPEQWAVVQALAEEFFIGEGARPYPRTIFAVGDEKQSIYSFQRVAFDDFATMRQSFATRIAAARARWQEDERHLSYRSVAAVLAAVDAVFQRTAAGVGVVRPETLIGHSPARVGQPGLVELWPPVEPEEPVEPLPWAPPLAQRRRREPRVRLAQAIAATIRQWIDTREPLAARDRPIRAGDILVLVRRRDAFVGELVRALKQREVPVAGVDRMTLTDQLAVEDLMALGNFLVLPEDDLTLATVLKGPLFGFDDDLLYDLAQPRPATLWAELGRRRAAHPLFAAAAAELSALLARADYRPPYELFAEVLGARGGRRKILARLGPEAGDPLDEFLIAALGYEREHGPSLQGFLHWLAVGESEVKRDLEPRRDEVRVLTVHGAKGLQAPIVFLPDTLQPPQQSPDLLWSESGLPLWLAARDALPGDVSDLLQDAKDRRDQEYHRLLYVAMTRAEDRLYICGWRNRRAAASGHWHGFIAEGLAAAGAEPFPLALPPALGAEAWTGDGLRLVTAAEAPPQPDPALVTRAGRQALPGWSAVPPAPEPTPPRPLIPSRPATEPAARSPLGGGDGGIGLQRGRLVHRLLQSLPELPAAARDAAARRFLARPVQGLPPATQEAIRRETLAILDHPDFAPLFGPDSQAEVPVVGLIGDRALSGRIDRLVVLPEEVLIVDYKTLRPVPADAASVPAVYLDQLAAYRAAVAAIYPGRAVRCALLWTEGPLLMPISPAQLGGEK